MVSICVICMVKEPPLTPLNSEHRQLLQTIVSPVINTKELEPYQLLHCMDCNVLLQSLYSFQQTALRGVKTFKCLLSKHNDEQNPANCDKPIPEAKPDIVTIKIEPKNEPVVKEEFISVADHQERNPLEEVYVKTEPVTRPDYDSESTINCPEPEEMIFKPFTETDPLSDIENKRQSPQVKKVVIPICVTPQLSQETQALKLRSTKQRRLKIVPSTAQCQNFAPSQKQLLKITPSSKQPVNIVPSTKVLNKVTSTQQIVNGLSSKNIGNVVKMTSVKIVPSNKRPVHMILSAETHTLPPKLVKIVPTTMTGNIVPARIGNIVRTGRIGNIVPTTTTGNIVPTTTTGGMVPSTSTGNIVRTGRIGNIVPTTTTGNIVPTTMTGGMVPSTKTGNIVSTTLTTKDAAAINAAAEVVQKGSSFEVFTHCSKKAPDFVTQQLVQPRKSKKKPYLNRILRKNGVHVRVARRNQVSLEMNTIKRRKNYTDIQLQNALTAVKEGMSTREASLAFSIPYTTIHNKINNIHTGGAQIVLTEEEESQIVSWILFLTDAGFTITKQRILNEVKVLRENLQSENPFSIGAPGGLWYKDFLARHPDIIMKISQRAAPTYASKSKESIRKWFSSVYIYLKNVNLQNVLNDPRRVYNCGESAFYLSPEMTEVLMKITSNNLSITTEKLFLAVMLTVSADGNMQPPFVIFPIPNGSMTFSHINKSATCFEQITNVFYPWLVENNIPLPVILFVNANFYINLSLYEFCRDKSIVLIPLPNTLQPLNEVFLNLKQRCKKVINNIETGLKEDFSKELDECIKNAEFNGAIISGFRNCGLYPFESINVDYNCF